MREMNKQHIETEATLALARLRSRSEKPDDALCTLIIMQNVCAALGESDYGERAVETLLDLWRKLNLTDISVASISELRAVVDHMHRKISNESGDKAEA